MKRALVVVGVLAASTSAASAGVYGGLGIGTDAHVNGIMHTEEGGRSARLLGGYAWPSQPWGQLSIEASLTGQTLRYYDNAMGLFDAKQLGLAGKYNRAIGYSFELYGKLGVHHMWLDHEQSDNVGDVYNSSGSGFLLGAGVEYRFSLGPVKSGSLFLDYTHYRATLEGPAYTHDGAGIGMFMLGFTVHL